MKRDELQARVTAAALPDFREPLWVERSERTGGRAFTRAAYIASVDLDDNRRVVRVERTVRGSMGPPTDATQLPASALARIAELNAAFDAWERNEADWPTPRREGEREP